MKTIACDIFGFTHFPMKGLGQMIIARCDSLDKTSLIINARNNPRVRIERIASDVAFRSMKLFSELYRRFVPLAILTMLISLEGCVAIPPNSNGLAAREHDPSIKGAVTGTGIESQDIMAMTDQMLRDLLATPEIVGRGKAPRILLDDSNFKNQSTQSINRNLIVDRLRVGLNRAARGRMTFLSREHIKAVEQERQLKREGVTDVGTTGLTKAYLGLDYSLSGRIASQDSRAATSGLQQRYMQITFEMFDMETSAIIWSNQYEFAKSAADDVVYR